MPDILKQQDAQRLFFKDGKFSGALARWNASKAQWLSGEPGESVSEKVWNLFNVRPMCSVCSGRTSYINFTEGYRDLCSQRCKHEANRTSAKAKDSTAKRWQDPTFRERAIAGMRRTKFERRKSEKILEASAAGFEILEDPVMIQKSIRYKHLCGHVFERDFGKTKHISCPMCSISNIQGIVYTAALSVDESVISNDRKILNGLEIDVYSKKSKIGVEVNGSFWHSDQSRDEEKARIAKSAGVKLIFVQDVQLIQNEQAVLSRIKAAFCQKKKVFGRKCTISTSPNPDFLEAYHTQGSCQGKWVSLEYGSEVLATLVYGPQRFGKDKSVFEIYRWCVKPGYQILGGFRKALSAAPKKKWVSYCDVRWAPDYEETVYFRAGFSMIKRSKPGYVWKKGMRVLSRYNVQKKSISKFIDTCDLSGTEDEIMVRAGWTKVFDFGNWVFELDNRI